MDSSPTFVIVGGGLAGAQAAQSLRDSEFTGRIILIGDEPRLPYERPPLSKGILRGDDPDESADALPADFYTSHEIELMTGTEVTEIDTDARVVHAGGNAIPFDRLLVATGSTSRHLPLPGADLAGIHYLRTFEDMTELRSALKSSSSVAIVGAGWIGSEVAASARQLGLDVTIIDMAATPLEAVVGRQIGEVFADLHREHGVTLTMNANVKGFVGSDNGRVVGIETADGRVDADVVVVGIGASPRTELAESAGLEISATTHGITVDTSLQTSVPGIYAAGDVASVTRPDIGIDLRVEHWATALTQGQAAGRNMLGAGEAYMNVPFFFSDQYDLGLEYCGYPVPWDRVVVRGDTGSREFIAFWLSGSRVTAAMNVNVWDVNETLQALIASGRSVDDSRLADSDVPLESL
ncbi:NAD(P)/FAD-dependent oxidoreductase [Spelaeicoccus albus]|uniref:3-phenylpropionate/trans-cinnamate dioxygenase ferredoxin reductase subunit n=1 Tax=Spelaeicoccus albus TaxID=1280376 RepID=A0A7Z0IHI2_9MICO|nr:FAD-dependent oxidoreductase [Spelaeicoccus albus]NYI67773.1 3-phenylpropionate/trans-cinnamate dioxygenase ferredoxin reductase subunit [Spelaeicoccus albus]